MKKARVQVVKMQTRGKLLCWQVASGANADKYKSYCRLSVVGSWYSAAGG